MTACILLVIGVILGPSDPIPTGGGRTTAADDYVNIWGAATLTVQGQVNSLYDPKAYNGFLRQHISSEFAFHNWSYPPLLQLWIWPFAYVPYELGYVLWLVVTFTVFAAGARRLGVTPRETYLLLFSGASICVILTGQNGFLTAGLFLLGLAWRKDRALISACCFALLTFKPHLGILIPILLLYERNWRVLFLTPIIIAALVGLTIILWGTAPWVAYFTVTTDIQWKVFTDWDGIFKYMMPSLTMALLLWEMPFHTALWFQGIYTGALLGFYLYGLFRAQNDNLRLGLTLLCAIAILPYSFVYDMMLYQMAILLWWKEQHPRNLPSFAVLWLWPLISLVIAITARLQLSPVLYVIVLWQFIKRSDKAQ